MNALDQPIADAQKKLRQRLKYAGSVVLLIMVGVFLVPYLLSLLPAATVSNIMPPPLPGEALDVSSAPEFAPQPVIQDEPPSDDALQALLEQARVAALEGRIEDQIFALQQAHELAPQDTTLAQTLADVLSQQAEKVFGQQFAQAWQVIEQGELARAQTLLEQLQAHYPQQPALTLLEHRLFALSAAAVSSPDADRNADQNAPSPQLAAQTSLAFFLQRPQRLSDARIAAAAQQALVETAPLQQQHEQLSDMAQQLQRLLTLYQQPITVKLLSDNATQVRLRGQGLLGQFHQREIQLTPGEYRLEGRCSGYRDEVVMFRLSPTTSPEDIRIICQQKL